MIVMIVADENQIDRRKILEADAWRAMTLRSEKPDRRCALGPDRIGEDVDAIELDQRRRVIDERDAQLAARDALRRRLAKRCVGPRAPLAAIAREHPFEK